MDPQFTPVSRKNGIVVQRLEDETLVYDLENNRAMCLNKTAADVWRYCDGKNTVIDIRDILSIKLKTDVTIGVVEFALGQLASKKLIDTDFTTDFVSSKESRREAIKKMGFASTVALPMIAAIFAPRAINAQSGMAPAPLGDGSACTSTAQCSNACCELQPGGGGICGPNNGRTCL